jgi:hypothetical protein
LTGNGSQGPASPQSWSLPPLQLFSGSDWPTYESRIYQLFRDEFLVTPVIWRGQQVTVQREPLLNGKEEGFWHVVTETGPSGKVGDRVPDLDRCSRILWVKTVLTAPESEVRTFGQMRGSYQHYGIALPNFSYIVFLRQWPGKVQLKAAYYVFSSRKQARYRQEWEADKR